jgi:hypothetical protein
MSVWRLVLREIAYRRLSFALAVLAVVVAVGCLVGELTLLRLHDLQTEEMLAAREREVNVSNAALVDDFRKITLHLGFNLKILSAQQSPGELDATGNTTATLPESYVTKLASAGVITINHLLPVLQQRVKWPEQERTIVLVGTHGEVPIAQRNEKKPLLERVPRGAVVVGYELHRSLKLAKGGKLRLLGRDFTIHKLHPERGDAKDITLWINLAEAQELLNKPKQITAILALECMCSADRLPKIRSEVAKLLPDTQVAEVYSLALARAEARTRAATDAEARLEKERQNRAAQRRQLDEFAAVFVPLVLFACIIWIGLLTLTNVRERTLEIGILRALGLRGRQVFAVVLARAVIVGLSGALVGCALGTVGGAGWAGVSWEDLSLFEPVEQLVAVVVAAPLLCAVAAWLPALAAARRDPALILREA